MRVGAVREVWRYPVKSMMGQRIGAGDVTRLGLVGDRGWACRDEVRGGIRGAKKIGGLMRLAARYDVEPTASSPSPPVTITLPDGSTVGTGDPGVDERVSTAVDHPVTLWPLRPPDDVDHYRRGPGDTDDIVAELRDIFGRDESEPLPDLSVFPPEIVEFESLPGTYYDAYPLHLLTDASLRTLERRLPGSVIDVRRFRPNLLVALDAPAGPAGPDGSDDPGAAGGSDPFPEQAWLGRRIRVGADEYDVVAPCPRCVMPTRDFADLPADRDILHTIVSEAQQNLGVYLVPVADAGRLAEGDEVAVVG